MLLDRLSAELAAPHSRLSELDERLHLDVDRYRALLMQEARALCESGHIDAQVVAWAFACIADGWVDEHLQHVRDSLLELGAVADQGHLDRLLRAAVLQVLGTQEPLGAADALLLETVTQPQRGADAEPLGLRLLARRYARELGLLDNRGAGALAHDSHPAVGAGRRTRLGEVALRLPRPELPVYLLALEMLQSTGAADRWRTPRRTLALLVDRREFLVPTTEETRRTLDPEGLLPWRRVRRLTLMGLCEPVGEAAEGAAACQHRLLPRGEAVLRQTLAEPRTAVVALAAAVLEEHTREALRPLLGLGRLGDEALGAPAAPVGVERRAPAPAPLVGAAAPGAPRRPREVAVLSAPGGRGAGSEARVSAPAREHQGAARFAMAQPHSPATMRPAVAVPRVGVPQAPEVPPAPTALAGLPAEPPPRPQAAAAKGEDIGQLLQRAWDEIQARQVQFVLRGSAEPVAGDRRALLQALREVLRCAADAAARGARAPLVMVEVQGGARQVAVLVSDNGPPQAPAEPAPDSAAGVLELLITRSGALRVSTEPVPAGLGLALAASRLGGVTVQLALPRAGAAAVRDAA